MLSKDVLRKIKHIEIYTRRLLSGTLAGDKRSALKGTGFEFDQIRQYQMGDDVRFIDWLASARSNQLLVKEYIEERSRTILLAVDVSASTRFGSGKTLKKDLMAQIASVLAIVADFGSDHVGLLLFSDTVEKYIPPRAGRSHIRRIMQELFTFEPKKSGTDMSVALKQLAQLKRKDSIAFLISDFIGDYQQSYISFLSKRYDLVAIRCLDENEQILPNAGFITVNDIETGEEVLLDLRRKGGVNNYLKARLDNQNTMFKRYGVDLFDISAKREFIPDVVRFFRRRMQY